MCMWINLMTKTSPRKSEVTELLSSKVSTPPEEGPALPSPWSSYLYTPQTSSPYSSFFDTTTTSPFTWGTDTLDYSSNNSTSISCHSDISTPDLSRPTSRLSELPRHSYLDSPSLTHPGRISPRHPPSTPSPSSTRRSQGTV